MFKLDNVVPWGRSMEEYVGMFELSRQDLDSRILGCADGPASFNAQMHQQGHRVVSIDPLYQFPAQEICGQVERVYPTIVDQLDVNLDDYLWDIHASPQALSDLRIATMDRFLDDLPQGLAEGRYLLS